MTHQIWDSVLHPIVRLVSDHNSVMNHGLEDTCAYKLRKNGSVFEALKGGTTTGAGTIAFGGSGNAGATDGSNAADVINASLAAIETQGGGGLYWKYAEYLIDSQLSIPSNLWMRCDPGTIIKLDDAANSFILRAKGADAGAPTYTRNVDINGFEFDGNGAAQGAGGQLSLTAIQDWVFTHNYVHDTRSVAVYVQPIGDPETPTVGCDRNYFGYNRIEDQANSSDLFIMGMRYSTVEYNYLSGTVGNYLLSGAASSRGLRVEGNTLRSGGLTGIGMENSQRCQILNNDISGMGGHGINVKQVGVWDAPENIIIRDNITQSNGDAGIYISDACNHIIIDGNHSFDNTDAGITTYNCQNWSITNNIVYDNDQGAVGVPDNTGIRVGHAGDTGVIEGNTIYDGGGATQDYGIYFEAHAAVVLGDNRIYGNTVAPIGNIGSASLFVARRSINSVAVDLSGGAVTVPVFHANTAAVLLKLNLLYTEATVAENVTIEVGKETDRDYYYTGTSEQSKALWYEHPIDQLNLDIAAGDTLTFYTVGDGAGTGEIVLVMDYGYGVE